MVRIPISRLDPVFDMEASNIKMNRNSRIHETVIHVGNAYKQSGGISKFIQQLEGLSNSRISHEVFDVGVIDGQGPIWFIKGLAKNATDVPRFLSRIKTTDPDIVHIHSAQIYSFYRAAIFAAFTKIVFKKPVVFHAHGSTFADYVRSPPLGVGLLQRYIFEIVDGILCVSEDTASAIAEQAPRTPISVVRHGVDIESYQVSNPRNPRIVTVTNLIERKGIRDLLKAIEEIDASREYTVDIAGSGELSSEVEQAASKYDFVTYHGYVSDERKQKLISEATIYVLPTYSEAGVPISIVEGMAGGNAVVTTPVTGIDEVLDDSNGRIVEPGDSAQLAEALEFLIDRPDMVRRIGNQNREMVENDFTVESVNQEIIQFYDEIR